MILLLLVGAAMAVALPHQCLVMALAMPSPASISMARRAIDLSNKANADPSFADEACKLWTTILDTDDIDAQLPLPLAAMPAAHALHASTLARVGRDKEAITEYQKSMSFLKVSGALSKPLTKEEVEIRMGRAKSLQRMLRYYEAADTFLGVAARCVVGKGVPSQSKETWSWVQLAHSESTQSAALCYMRVGDFDSAVEILEKIEVQDAEAARMRGALLLLQLQSPSSIIKGAEKRESIILAQELLAQSSDRTSSPLYDWLYLTTQIDQLGKMSFEPFQCIKEDPYLSFAKVNISPFDDPDLINLDDKILLHATVMASCQGGTDFWPRGYVLPDELNVFKGHCKENNIDEKDAMNKKKWILKERSGYGSHGNTIAATDEVLSMYDATDCQQILCQRIVEPPMLIDGRKFSLRIYVVYFPNGKILSEYGEETLEAEVHVSTTEGLVKYAAVPFIDGEATDSLDDQYMTNSGRGDGRTSLQHDLRQLQSDFQKIGLDYDNMWNNIEQSIQVVMKRYVGLRHESTTAQTDNRDSSSGYTFIHSTYAPFCNIPKILGFDYILDSSMNPYLLEVNRFPGLEPRSSMDSDVKHSVVYDAWIAASDRTGITREHVQILRPSNYKEFSLKKLDIH